MSAKTVSKGAIPVSEFRSPHGLPDGDFLTVQHQGCLVLNPNAGGRLWSILTPEQSALFARAVLEAQGWLFSKDGGCAAEFKRYPTVADPEGLGDGMAQALARAVLEKGGWKFGTGEGDPDPVIAVRPSSGCEGGTNLREFALGVLSSALQDPASADAIRRKMLGLLVSDPPEPSTEKAH